MLNRMQQDLIEIVTERFSSYNGGLGLSVPHIPRVSERYLDSRVVVVGQETNTWYRKTEDDLLNVFASSEDKIETTLRIRYDEFVKNNAEKYGGSFWKYCRLLHDDVFLDKQMIVDGNLQFCWLNLFLVEACKNKNDVRGRPSQNVNLANEVGKMQRDALFEMLKVLKPRIMLFLTGRNEIVENEIREHVFKSSEISFDAVDLSGCLSNRQLSRINFKGPDLFGNPKVVVAYHPGYFMGRINNKNTKLYEDLKRKGIANVNSYYQDLLAEELKSYIQG